LQLATKSDAKREAITKATKLVSQQWSKAQAIPIRSREAVAASVFFQDYLEDVRGALQEDQGIDLVHDDRDPDRFVTIKVGRPKLAREQIVLLVAEAETQRRGRRVSPRMVKTCWAEFSKLARRCKGQLG
jgi:hypothetical protein